MILLDDDIIFTDKVKSAETFFQRLIGLMGKNGLEPGEGLFFRNCSSVHCFFMKFPIDVVYLSAEMKIIAWETIKPWHIGSFIKGAKHVLELSAGEGSRLTLGGQITIK